jgi:hypothetical protein
MVSCTISVARSFASSACRVASWVAPPSIATPLSLCAAAWTLLLAAAVMSPRLAGRLLFLLV